jgi:hypothetical protein
MPADSRKKTRVLIAGLGSVGRIIGEGAPTTAAGSGFALYRSMRGIIKLS